MTKLVFDRRRCGRRNFLQVGTAALFGLSFSDLLAARSLGGEGSSDTAAARNCIFVWLAGGPATIDMWDMKPEAPSGIRGEFRPIATAVPGISVCEHLPEMVKVMDRCTLVRSVSHTLADHGPGTELVVTGHAPNAALTYPSLGSMASKLLPDRPGVPKYITLGDSAPGGSGFLGASASPFHLRPADLAGRDRSTVPVELPDGFSVDDLDRRESLLKRLDREFAVVDRAPLAGELSSFQRQALDILRSNKTRRALDLQAEPESSRARYGNGWAGQALLAARRLVEADVGFVTVSIAGWDTHQDNFGQLRSRLLPQLDRALSALIGDLDERGLMQETIVYCAGEFGRTPFVNGQAGRDHWARVMSVLLAGGSLPRGYVHGETDERGMEPTAERCSPADINATLLSLLGVRADATFMTSSGRPLTVFGDGVPIEKLAEARG
ncbi:MAG: DUF1501 domain-containing protein [Pirellulales bacterium]